MPKPMTGRIVVGVDGSESSKRALRWAAAMARASGSTLDAVMAWEVPVSVAIAYLPRDVDLGRDTENILTEAVDEVFENNRPQWVHPVVHCGNPAHILLEAAKDAQLLVVGSRGHGGFYGLLLGSVSAAVAEHAGCPVLVVHGDQPPVEFTA